MSSRDATPVAASRRLVGRQSIFGLKPLERLDAVSGVSGGIHIYMDTSDTPALADATWGIIRDPYVIMRILTASLSLNRKRRTVF